jgi:pimeloyl-ACP methyl ester carboxylesterase
MPRRTRLDPPLAPFRSEGVQTLRQGETAIAYQMAGGGGPVVLLLQPFWVGMEDLESDESAFVPQLVAGHRVIVHDRRGTGFSDRHPGQVSVKVQVEDLVAVLDEIGVTRVLVVAMSEAAPLAVHFAAQNPERVARLVLVDPQLRPRIGPGSTMLLHTLHSRPRAGLKAFARSLIADDMGADELATRMSARLDAPTAARLYEAFLQADALELAAEVQARTLHTFGVHDKLVVEDEARTLQSQFATATVSLVRGTPGTAEAVSEAWTEMQDFLVLTDEPEAVIAPVIPRRRANAPASVTAPPPPVVVGDFVPLGPPPEARTAAPSHVPAGAAFHGQPAPKHPGSIRWASPTPIPQEAVDLNRKAVDHILLGEIEEALLRFQEALEIAPEYEDAQVNYRELLSRLVQRRVAQWQTEQAEMMLSEAGRKASRYAKRSRKLSLGRLIRSRQAA